MVIYLNLLLTLPPPFPAGWSEQQRGRAPAAAAADHLADVQARRRVVHRHATQQAVAAEGVPRAVPAGAQRALAHPRTHTLGLARGQPG